MMTDTEQQLLAHSQRFEALLNEELAVLRDHGDADRLRELAEQKMDCCQQLETLERLRQQQQPERAMSAEVTQSLRRCRDLNERIGSLLSRQQDYNEQAMHILGLGSPTLRTYGADGQTGASAYSRRLGEA
ncbi:flagella synthesis protein FlgN [Spongiibacter sp. UBA1325]|uniref:flagella synthesis protein FlgN n=1 Tax=Spongiibacter sp. UBA1325 TaxID=1947543 RepID=UPI00257B1FB3|nr:flagellar export chaperone FlgN [Spongiibacter sp. UBA1325]|tara:strand:- start:16640 stop:17032 length:393 start_codon:yes stop_codon:yes gene_type:complete